MGSNLPFAHPVDQPSRKADTTQPSLDSHQPILFHPILAEFGYSVMDGYRDCWRNTWRKRGKTDVDLGIELAKIA